MNFLFKKLGLFLTALSLMAALLAPLHVHAGSQKDHGLTQDCSVCHIQGQVRHVTFNNPLSKIVSFYSQFAPVLGASFDSPSQIYFSQNSSRAPPVSSLS